ncbi:MAG: 30S ribosome-binding factor RbfA [Phycisphaerales bacterium]
MNQRRPEQLATILHRAVQARLDKGLADPRIGGLITVTEVKVSSDLKTATVSVSVMPHEKQDLTLHGLRSAARHIRREVGDQVAVHRMPELSFRLDKSLEKQAGVLGAIARATEERERKESASQPSSADPSAAPEGAPQPEPGGRDAYAGEPDEETKA